jgi:hypothetical protein
MLLSRMGNFGEGLPVPVLFGDVIGFGHWRREGKMPDYVFPPTAAGYAEFLKRAVAGDKLKGAPGRAEIHDVALWWWGRSTPRDLFIEAEFADAMNALNTALAEYDKTKSNRVLVVMRAIEANTLRPIDDATLQRLASVMEGLDDRIVTDGLPTWKVRSLIALRQRMGRATAPSSQRAVVAVAPAAVSTRPSVQTSGHPSVRATPASAPRPSVRAAPVSVARPSVQTSGHPSVRPAPASRPRPSVRPAPASGPRASVQTSRHPSVQTPAFDDELLAALELDPELAVALELDGDDLMAALELDPELLGAIELDEVALG